MSQKQRGIVAALRSYDIVLPEYEVIISLGTKEASEILFSTIGIIAFTLSLSLLEAIAFMAETTAAAPAISPFIS